MKNESVCALVKQFKISKSQAANIKNKKNLLQMWQENINTAEKWSFFFKGRIQDRSDVLWMVCEGKKIQVSDFLLQSKAKENANSLGYDNFEASGA